MSFQNKPGVVILYGYFYPAYKAGGPIQSLTNLIISLKSDYRIFVYTSAYDLNEHEPHAGIKTDCWRDVTIPLSGTSIKVWYATGPKAGINGMRKAINETGASIFYINGMFSYAFTIVPLLLYRRQTKIICPRGMLQKGALAGKPLKKKLYLWGLKISGLCRNAYWHATNEEEQQDIRAVFGDTAKVVVAGNIPRKPLDVISPVNKRNGQLHLIYLSLITAKKNLLQLLNIIELMEEKISLHIYGPVKDESYWNKCLEAIKRSGGKIEYKGDVRPDKVQEIFEKYDASILLTKGENFGHALYESFSVGRPVITSYFTPWNQLDEKRAGWNVDISVPGEISSVLKKLCDMEKTEYDNYCNGAHQLAKGYYQGMIVEIEKYRKMFTEIR